MGWSPSAAERLALALVCAAYVLLRVLGIHHADVLATPDTEGWMTLGWTVRPPVVPLLWKVCGDRPEAIAWLQFAISVSSWTILAVSVAATVRAAAPRWLALLVFLALSLNPDVALWDKVLMSESLSLSFLALVASAWLGVSHRWTIPRATGFTILCVCWCLCRDTNAWAGLGAAGIGGVLACRPGQHRKRTLLLLVFVPLFAISSWTQDLGERWLSPLLNVLSTRVLTDPDRTGYFRAAGMPVTSALTANAGQFAAELEQAVPQPDFTAFRDWTRHEGKRVYARFLLEHPDVAFNVPLRNVERLLTLVEESYQPRGFRAVLPAWLSEALYPERILLLALVYGSMVLLGASVVGPSVRAHRLAGLGCLGVILTYPQLVLAWHGDSMDPGRHALGAGVELRLSCWALAFAWLDRPRWWSRRPSGGGT